MQSRIAVSNGFAIGFLLVALGMICLPTLAGADQITFSGTVSYQGTYSGDSLFVAVLDTTGVEDVTIVALESYAVSTLHFNQAYSLGFDNTGVAAMLLVASFLDVDGGGVDSVSSADVLGWYSGGSSPTGISSSASQSGLDFDLPLAEIHGTVTFASGQTNANIEIHDDPLCVIGGFRPSVDVSSEGPYSIIGIYPSTYCVGADGFGTGGFLEVCYGDPTCASPTTITLGATEVRMGIDLDFSALAPTERITWGRIKSRYP